jgi:hypothetical protein
MLLVLLLAATAAPAPKPGTAAARATAQGRVLHAEPASRVWKEGSAQKREIVVREADGSLTRLRLVEHE